ncbi:MAG: oxygenase MpaB family protein [Acidimicrobiales bacterium]|nr:oxygenase MpaB family protein [Acidimicrobiales bacterium]
MTQLSSREITTERINNIVWEPMSDALRNYLVTICYVDLSNRMAELLGDEDANWCCLAVWPSFTVGETIRDTNDSLGLTKLTAKIPFRNYRQKTTAKILGGSYGKQRVVNRSIAAGNRGVFFEIAMVWADFMDTFADLAAMSSEQEKEAWTGFTQRVRDLPKPPGKLWPVEHREGLIEGCEKYLEAMHTDDDKRKAELILHGNLLMGYHEQSQLQGWLDLSLGDNPRRFIKWSPLRFVPFVRGPMERGMIRMITEYVFVVHMDDEVVRVGRDLPPKKGMSALYEGPLAELTDPELVALVEQLDDADRDDDAEGARRWNDFNDRMRFISSLFRSRQRQGLVGIMPYTDGQYETIMAEAAEIDRANALRDGDGGYEANEYFPVDAGAPWSEEQVRELERSLTDMRQECDPAVDEVVYRFFLEEGTPREDRHFTHVMKALPRANDYESLREYLARPPEPPSWTDPEKLKKAREFYDNWRPAIQSSLAFGSLPASYSAADGAQVLGLVSGLTNNVERRIWETARYLEDVMTTDFLDPDSDGWRSISGVRLLHASVRHMIENGSQRIRHDPEHPADRAWNTSWGRPINQEDVLGTALTFNAITIDVMDRVGIGFDPENADAFMHAWNVIGVLMGVPEEHLTSRIDPSRDLTFEEGRYVLGVINHRHRKPSIPGQKLTAELLAMFDGWFIGPMEKLPRAFMRVGLGDEVCDVVGVPPRGFLERMIEGSAEVSKRMRMNGMYRWMMRRSLESFGDAFLQYYAVVYKDEPPYRQRPLPEAMSTRRRPARRFRKERSA